MTTADPAPLIRAIDVLRISLNLPTSAERKANAAREIERVSMYATRDGVRVGLPNGKKLFIAAKAFKE